METFYCVGCRVSYPIEKAARLVADATRDEETVGFCFLCVREVQSRDDALLVAAEPRVEQVASA